MQQNYPFQPRGSSATTPTIQYNAPITTGITQVTFPPISQDGASVLIAIDGASNVSWCYGVSSGLTVGNGSFMFGNTKETFGLPGGVTQISLIGASAVGTFRVIIGDGT